MDCLTNYLPPAIAPTCPGFFQGVLALRSSMYDNQGACGMVMVCRIGGRQNNGETMKMPCYVGAMAGGRYFAMIRVSPSARLARRWNSIGLL